ncbi:MAG: hypothetical protein R3F50_08940 [Gammaproteobacteria bacterium]|jgi:hypothetical protein
MSRQTQQRTYTVAQLQQAVSAYDLIFDDQVPLHLLAAAAGSFRSMELMRTLLQCIDSGVPVTNWSEFTLRFLSGIEEVS